LKAESVRARAERITSVVMRKAFVAPDLEGALVVEDYVQRVPPYATIKGMFLTNLLGIAGSAQATLSTRATEYFAFRDYPLVEQVRLIPEIAESVFPDLPLRRGILHLGRLVCPAFAASLLGRVLFSAVGTDLSMLIRAGSKAYTISSNVGRVEILERAERSAQLSMRDMFDYVDCYQIGVLEGALMMLGYRPTIGLSMESSTCAEIQLSW
jgi:uncharacterized protein (TIGR02265 family)